VRRDAGPAARLGQAEHGIVVAGLGRRSALLGRWNEGVGAIPGTLLAAVEVLLASVAVPAGAVVQRTVSVGRCGDCEEFPIHSRL
jgi:hypothetical protein